MAIVSERENRRRYTTGLLRQVFLDSIAMSLLIMYCHGIADDVLPWYC